MTGLDQLADADGEPVPLADEVVTEKGRHRRAVVLDSYEPDRGPRYWMARAAARDAAYRMRRRIRGERG